MLLGNVHYTFLTQPIPTSSSMFHQIVIKPAATLQAATFAPVSVDIDWIRMENLA